MSTSQSREQTLGLILKQGLLPNLIQDGLDPFLLAEQAWNAGFACMEVSCRRDDTITLLPQLKNRFPDMRFGVSSLIEDGPYYDYLQQRGPRFPSIDEAVEAGADFLVSLIAFSPRTYQRHANLPIVPGVASPQEAREQLDLGAALIKLSLGAGLYDPKHVRATFHGGPMHFGIPLLLTGGLRPELIDTYTEAGMLVAVAGFDLILRDQYEQLQDQYEADFVGTALAQYREAFAAARMKHQPTVDFNSADAATIQAQTGRFMNV